MVLFDHDYDMRERWLTGRHGSLRLRRSSAATPAAACDAKAHKEERQQNLDENTCLAKPSLSLHENFGC